MRNDNDTYHTHTHFGFSLCVLVVGGGDGGDGGGDGGEYYKLFYYFFFIVIAPRRTVLNAATYREFMIFLLLFSTENDSLSLILSRYFPFIRLSFAF